MKRTKLSDRSLPTYTRGEECMNMITHIVGGALGIVALPLCLVKAADLNDVLGIVIYSACMVILYTMSSVYHGLRPGMAKKVMQVIDHCTIYLLIAGSYTAVLLCGVVTVYPRLSLGLLILEWGLTALAVTLTAIDLKRYNIFSMVCYIGMGWAVIPFWRQVIEVLTFPGFLLLLLGGIAYTIGSILYGIGKKKSGCIPFFISSWFWAACCSSCPSGSTPCNPVCTKRRLPSQPPFQDTPEAGCGIGRVSFSLCSRTEQSVWRCRTRNPDTNTGEQKYAFFLHSACQEIR